MKTRHECRDALAALLQAALAGPGLPVQVLLGYPPGELHGESPLVYVGSAGSARQALTVADSTARLRLAVTVLVLHTDGDRWTPANAEDALDDIEALIGATVNANQRTAHWHRLGYAAAGSACDLVAIGGAPYRREVIPLEVEIVL